MTDEAVDAPKPTLGPVHVSDLGKDLSSSGDRTAKADASPAGEDLNDGDDKAAPKTEQTLVAKTETVSPVGKDAVEKQNPSEAAFVHVDERFTDAAKLFLGIHRGEIAQREAEIDKLQTELRRVREGLKALEKTQRETDDRNQASKLLCEESQNAQTAQNTQGALVELKAYEPEAA